MESAASSQMTPAGAPKHSLKDSLSAALSSDFKCNVRYIHSPPKPCESLFSALPGHDPEKTFLASHFLTVSVDSKALAPQVTAGQDVFSFAIEALVYTTKRLTTIFVSKVDSTPYIPRVRPSPIKTSVTTFLQWLADEELRKRPKRKIVISLFARAQAQYLFPASSDNKTKHVLDDRQLIKWWARVLDPILPTSNSDTSSEKDEVRYQGYLTVPGYVGNELKSFMPPSPAGSDGNPHWLPGNPLLELARTRGMPEHAPPRCLLPRFPDDPKARYMLELDEEIGISQDAQVHISPSKRKSGRWNSVRDLERFWEAMEFRNECSAGRVVGFLWLVISPRGSDVEDVFSESFNSGSQDSLVGLPSSDPTYQPGTKHSSPKKKRKRRQLSGPIIPRQPRLKGGSSGLSNLSNTQDDTQATDGLLVSKDGYDKALQTMLNLDFSSLEYGIRSTSKWIAEVTSIAGLNGDFATAITGTAKSSEALATNGAAPAVNDLGGMVRKKRKAGEEASAREAAVNMLGAGTIRKKPKAAS